MAPMKCLKVQVSDSILEMPGTWYDNTGSFIRKIEC